MLQSLLRFRENISAIHLHAVISRTSPALGTHPVDILREVFDVAGLAVDAVLSIDNQAHALHTVFTGNVLVDTYGGFLMQRRGEGILLPIYAPAGQNLLSWPA